MTRIDKLLTAGSAPAISFEFFPPKTEAGAETLRRTLAELDALAPAFVSITYGAGGSTRERTHNLVVDILSTMRVPPMAHLTTVSHTRDELVDILTRYRDAGVRNIMALRGDPPGSADDVFYAVEHAADLVALAREVGGDAFSLGVAAHPEGHPDAPDLATDRRYLAAKLREADFAVTQFFFDVTDYLRLVDDLDRLGCDRPVIPGIMPVTSVRQITRMAELSSAAFPASLADRLRRVEHDDAEVARIGVEVATQLCTELLEQGAPGLHFYTLNRSTATREIHANLGQDAAI